MKIHTVTFVLLIIGGLNWGLEVLGYGLGNYLPASVMMIVYILVALSALYEVFSYKKLCCNCNLQGGMMEGSQKQFEARNSSIMELFLIFNLKFRIFN